MTPTRRPARSHAAVIALALGAMLATGIAGAQTTDPAPEAPATDAPATDAPATDAPADPNAEGLSLGEDVTGIGTTYTRETLGDWALNCVRVPEGQQEPCQLYQLLKDAQGVAVAEINIVPLQGGGEAVTGATIITPLETLLTEQLTIAVDGGQTKRYPFTFCAAIGCIARVGFTADDLASFKKGNKATLSVVPVAAPDQKVNVDVSLKGFTAAYDAVIAAVAPAQE
jgi:invasion protein IalB